MSLPASAGALPAGTYDDARALVGHLTAPRRSGGQSMIKYFCSSVEDPNPSYWDEMFADEHWAG